MRYGDGRKSHWSSTDKIGWLGSGVKDKNGVEIFEGDKVKALTPDGDYDVGVVTFDTGWFLWTSCSSGWLTELESGGVYELEVVGHVEEEE